MGEDCDNEWKSKDEEPTPVVKYISGEMVNNAKSEMVKTIGWFNLMSKLFPPTKFHASLFWASMVRDGGPWDHKGKIRQMSVEAGHSEEYQIVGEWKYKFDTWSNIHYGYVGAAAGFSSEELLQGAGLEQIGTNFVDREPIVAHPGVSGWKQFDDPYDQAGIQLGINLWNEYNLGLQPYHIIQSLNNAPSLNRKPIN